VCGEKRSKVALSLAETSLLLMSSCVSIGPDILNVLRSYSFLASSFQSSQLFTRKFTARREILFTDINRIIPCLGGGAAIPVSMVGSKMPLIAKAAALYNAATCYRKYTWIDWSRGVTAISNPQADAPCDVMAARCRKDRCSQPQEIEAGGCGKDSAA
jgi:hypothetical protein